MAARPGNDCPGQCGWVAGRVQRERNCVLSRHRRGERSGCERLPRASPGAAACRSEPFRPALHLEAAFFYALVAKSAERAPAHLAQVPVGALNVPDYDRARAAAALARLAGRPAEARAIAQAALARVPARSAYSRARLQELAADEATIILSE